MQKKAVGKQVLYPELSYKIMGILNEVHNHLGPGFHEEIYEKAVCFELTSQKIDFVAQKKIDVFYKGECIGIYRLDLVVDNSIILELKAMDQLADLHKQQLLSYLKATNLRLGILVNFGAIHLQYQRIIH